jgi:hypothetical protein
MQGEIVNLRSSEAAPAAMPDFLERLRESFDLSLVDPSHRILQPGFQRLIMQMHDAGTQNVQKVVNVVRIRVTRALGTWLSL